MTSRHTMVKLVTLTGVAFLCGIGSGSRLPAGTTADGGPDYRLAGESAAPSGAVDTSPGSANAAPGAASMAASRQEIGGSTRRPAVADPQQLSTAFADIAAAVTPAVVRIQTERSLAEANRDVAGRLRDMFNLPDDHPPPMYPELAGGSGVLVSPDGLILTNNHVIAGADRILVTLWDKRMFEATVVGADPTTDIALIVVDQGGLPAARLGDSDAARVGEWVLAIGNPGFQDANTLDFTVTSGILSAKGRPLDIIRQELASRANPAAPYAIEDFLQTDAAINPGNSGGPLIDLRGEVIGINTAIASGTGFNQGYGFAVPINVARRVMDDLLQYGRVRRPLLGISIQNVAPEDAHVYGLPSIAGVLVEDFQRASPAERAGLRRHDVIVAVNGARVDRLGQFQRLVARHEPGEDVQVDVIRYGDRLRFQVRLSEADLGRNRVVRSPERRTASGLGIEVVDLTPTLARERSFARPGGALIASVDPMSAASRRDVPRDVLIRTIDRQQVASAEDARRLLRAARPGSVVSLLLEDHLGSTFIRNVRVP
ncbi:MAG TPA: trypsin-like peptidase domain-containing protein [Longimicrobiales bacterium]|nr:trypsin-like peptidase domain-containing protein [Longimicrobiales bacterium]